MEHDAAIDVSLAWSSVGVVDAEGENREAKIPSERAALVGLFAESGLAIERIGLEAGPLSQWLHAGLVAAGLPAILIETATLSRSSGRRSRTRGAALKAMTVKTDRNNGGSIETDPALGAATWGTCADLPLPTTASSLPRSRSGRP